MQLNTHELSKLPESISTAIVSRISHISELARLAVLSVQSPHTRRSYQSAITRFIVSGHPLTRSGVMSWLTDLDATGIGSVSINCALAGVRKLIYEANAHGLISDQDLLAIDRIKSRKVTGTRLGNWTDVTGIQDMIRREPSTRNRAIIACMFGCGLRRSEVASLNWSMWQQRDNRWLWVDLVGKGGKTRTVPAPNWVADYVNEWQGRQEQENL